MTEPLRIEDQLAHAPHGDREPGLVKATLAEIDLVVALHHRPISANPVDRGIVGDDLVERALPDDDRTCRRDVVQDLPIDLAVPDLMVTPGDQRLARVSEAFLDLLEPVDVGVVAMNRGAHPVGQLPLGSCDEVTRQENSSERRMQVRIDEAGHQDVIAERRVDAVRVSVQPRL